MTYIFSDLEKTAILQAANVCDGMELMSSGKSIVLWR